MRGRGERVDPGAWCRPLHGHNTDTRLLSTHVKDGQKRHGDRVAKSYLRPRAGKREPDKVGDMPGPVGERPTDGPDQHRRGHVGTERLVSAAPHQNAQRVSEYDAEVDNGKGRQRERDVPGVIALETGIGAVNAVGLDAREQPAVRALAGQRGQPGVRVATAHAFEPSERVVADAPIWSGVGGDEG